MVSDPRVTARLGGPTTTLRGGRWALEVRGDEVADIRYDGVLLLRAVRPVVRDQDWNTVPVRVVQAVPGNDGRRLDIRLAFASPGIDYQADLSVTLADGQLAVAFRGRALTAFARNRIGLVLLHPAAETGRSVEVHHPDGSSTAGRWPVEISPHQPFREVVGFRWAVDGLRVELELDGEVFETEDQRNWTDASYKTYGTPLALPFPVPVEVGETCEQQVRLHVDGRRPTTGGPAPQTVTVSAEVVGAVPPISLGAALVPPPGEDGLAALAHRAGRYEAVLVELTGSPERWPELLTAAASQAAALDAGLDLRVVTKDAAALERCLATLPRTPIVRLAVFDPDDHVTPEALWPVLRDAGPRLAPAALVLAGTRAHFTELNRQQHRIPQDAPALTFSLTPQMHATEVPHLVDSLAAQRTVAENALRLAAGRPLHIGPVTLARRFNAVATGTPPDPATEALQATDPLQGTGFTVAWTLGSVAALTLPGVSGLTYYETVGPRGLVEADGGPTPAADVLDRLAALRGCPVLASHGPDGVAVLAVRAPDGSVEVALGDLTGQDRTLLVEGPDGGGQEVNLPGWSTTRVTSR